MSGNQRADLSRQNPEEEVIVHEQSLSHLSHFTRLDVADLFSEKSEVGSGFRSWRGTYVIHEPVYDAFDITEKILWDLERCLEGMYELQNLHMQ